MRGLQAIIRRGNVLFRRRLSLSLSFLLLAGCWSPPPPPSSSPPPPPPPPPGPRPCRRTPSQSSGSIMKIVRKSYYISFQYSIAKMCALLTLKFLVIVLAFAANAGRLSALPTLPPKLRRILREGAQLAVNEIGELIVFVTVKSNIQYKPHGCIFSPVDSITPIHTDEDGVVDNLSVETGAGELLALGAGQAVQAWCEVRLKDKMILSEFIFRRSYQRFTVVSFIVTFVSREANPSRPRATAAAARTAAAASRARTPPPTSWPSSAAPSSAWRWVWPPPSSG